YYIPMNREFLSAIGIQTSEYTVRRKDNHAVIDRIQLSFGERTPSIPRGSFGDSVDLENILPLIAKVRIGSTLLRSNYPMYLIGDVPYICIDDTNDFPVSSIDILLKGLSGNKEVQPPPYYNVFDYIPESKFVRDQGSTQKCWAFAACSMFEIKIALEEGKFLNLSEDHLIEHCPVPADALSGGNWGLSASYLTKLLGPTSEGSPNSARLGYYIEEYTEVKGVEEIKKSIQKNGAVLTSIYYGVESAKYYNHEKFAYYHSNDAHRPTHELILVGWDDAYPRENFKNPPPRDGAFIAMNSFGTNFGKRGFFYISYYDDIATATAFTIDSYNSHGNDFKVISKDRGGVTHFETVPYKRDLYAIAKFHIEDAAKIRGIGIYANGKSIVTAYYAKKMPTKESDLSFLGDTYFEKPGFKVIETFNNTGIHEDFYIVLKYTSPMAFSIPIEASYPGITYGVFSEPGTNFLGYAEKGEIISIPLEEIKKDGSIVLRLFIQ
ncbi:MAG: C1 family peptidase, partial [Bacillota bacterium]|nr:C1 family peptidase [Bacillota bacterium]